MTTTVHRTPDGANARPPDIKKTFSQTDMADTIKFQKLRNTLRNIGKYFNVTTDLLPQSDAEAEIRSSVSFRGSQLLILIFAIFVASLGLNTNSIPVIIGAMIISPLMGPIMGIGLGIGIQDIELVKRSTRNILMAVFGSIIASAIYFLISPQYEGSSQLLARTSPSIYDVFIALFGGAAGIVSVTCRNKASVMAGVAIATSLMPPLCTAGYGLATWQLHFFFGALYLFFTNAIFILFATWIGIKLFGYKKLPQSNNRRAKSIRTLMYIIVGLTIGVSVFLTVIMIKTNIFVTRASEFVEKEFVFPNTQVFSHREYVENGQRYIDVNLIGAALPMDSLKLAMLTKLNSNGLGGTNLTIKQGFGISSAIPQSKDDESLMRLLESELSHRQATIDSLRNIIAADNSFSGQSAVIAPEVRVLFPEVKALALSDIIAANMTSDTTDTLAMAFVDAPSGMNAAQRMKLAEFLQVRLKRKSVNITLNPQAFPWPRNPVETKPAAVQSPQKANNAQ